MIIMPWTDGNPKLHKYRWAISRSNIMWNESMQRRTALKVVTGAIPAGGLLGSSDVQAETLRALPAGHLPKDRRLEDLKDLNGYFPFKPSETQEAWQQRAEYVRRQILVALGLWPMPVKTSNSAAIRPSSNTAPVPCSACR